MRFDIMVDEDLYGMELPNRDNVEDLEFCISSWSNLAAYEKMMQAELGNAQKKKGWKMILQPVSTVFRVWTIH